MVYKLAVAFFFFLSVGLLLSWFVAGKLIAPMPSKTEISTSKLPISAFTITSQDDVSLSGWHVLSSEAKGVVVLVHGIRASKSNMIDRAELLYNAGYSTVMIDLRAHGESGGERITVGHLEQHDVRAAVGFAKAKHPGEPVGLIGVSLGGASAVLASPLDIDAAVLESVFSDIRLAVHNRVAARLGPLSWVPAEILLFQLKPRLGVPVSELRPIDNISQMACPVFIISGKADANTTAAEAEALFSKAPQPKKLWLIDYLGHDDIYAALPVEYAYRVVAFLNSNMR